MKKTAIIPSLVLCLLVSFGGEGFAFTSLGTDWVAEYPAACQTLKDAVASGQNCVLCHTSGFGLNAYGDDLNAASRDFAAIEGVDSDGDGRTNLQEILDDCTFPGDVSSVPVGQDSWAAVKALFQ